MKKSEAIRNIVAKHGMALTNQEIMNLCLSEHRLHCTSTQIIGTIGAYHDRMAIAGFAPIFFKPPVNMWRWSETCHLRRRLWKWR